MLTIQVISPAALRAAEGCDAPWETLPPNAGVDYSSYASVAAHAALLELDADGRVVYRIAQVEPARELCSEEQAYLLLERVATGEATDHELVRLDALARRLDQGAVPYRGWR